MNSNKGILFAILLSVFSTLTQAESSCDHTYDRPWRGFLCLYCMHREAPGGAAPITQVLQESCLKRTMLGFVVDGSFGWDPRQITQSIKTLTENGQKVWIHLYGYNGPAQRRWASGVFSSFAVMDPARFKERIVSDNKLQSKFRKIIRQRILPVVSAAVAVNTKISIAPGLEDNLDSRSFGVMLKMLRKELSSYPQIVYVRSPCYQCTVPSNKGFPAGVVEEMHTQSPSMHVRNGVVSTDGEYFRFSSESNDFPTLNELRLFLKRAGEKKNGFMLWVAKYQDTPPNFLPRSPNGRDYKAPSPREERELISFLRTS